MTEEIFKQEIKEVLASWCEAVNSRVVDEVVKHYAVDGILWGTISAIIRPGHELIKDYFENFLSKDGIRGEIIEQHTRIYGDMAVNSGSYLFSWLEKGEQVSEEARFSFVYRKQNDKWLIVDHHSSFSPKL